MNILLLLALTLWSPNPDQGYHGPTKHTRSQAYYERHLHHLQNQRHRRVKRSNSHAHPSLIRF